MVRCCICGKLLDGEYGNNPQGAVWKDENGNIVEAEFDEGCRCCDDCNSKYVIPGRLYKMSKSKGGNK